MNTPWRVVITMVAAVAAGCGAGSAGGGEGHDVGSLQEDVAEAAPMGPEAGAHDAPLVAEFPDDQARADDALELARRVCR